MRPSLIEAVGRSFAHCVAIELPQFASVKSKQALPGDQLFVWEFSPDLRFYIYLQINQTPNEDSFTVELACSTSDFPFSHAALGPTPQKDGSVRFRLPQLYKDEWRPKSAWEPWWWIGEPASAEEVTTGAIARAKAGTRPLTQDGLPLDEALHLVEPQVQDAFQRIKRFGIPFFEHFAQRHN
jgi:hypothetical protein